MPDCQKLVAEPENKLYGEYSPESFRVFWYNSTRSGSPSIKFLEDSRTSFFYYAVAMYNYDPWFNEFNKKLLHIVNFGFNDDTLQRRRSNRPDDEIPPLMLTMDHLRVGFLLCCIPTVLGLISFAVEIVIPKIENFKNAVLMFKIIRLHLHT